MNKASITAAFAQLLRDLPGEAPTGAQLDRWAERLTSAWCDELLGGELIDLDEALGSPLELTTKRQEIAMSGIRFSSWPHHLTLAIGEASVSYQPRHHVAGPSGRFGSSTQRRRRILQEGLQRSSRTPSSGSSSHTALRSRSAANRPASAVAACGGKGPPSSPPSGVGSRARLVAALIADRDPVVVSIATEHRLR